MQCFGDVFEKASMSMFLTMFFKTQNIEQTMHLTMLIAHPYSWSDKISDKLKCTHEYAFFIHSPRSLKSELSQQQRSVWWAVCEIFWSNPNFKVIHSTTLWLWGMKEKILQHDYDFHLRGIEFENKSIFCQMIKVRSTVEKSFWTGCTDSMLILGCL